MRKRKEVQFVEGLVMPLNWDRFGLPTEVKICTSGEIDYRVEMDGGGNILLGHVRDFVRVEGEVSHSENGRVIRVSSILEVNPRSIKGFR